MIAIPRGPTRGSGSWSIHMELRGPAHRSLTIGNALMAVTADGNRAIVVTRASIPLDAIRRPRDTSIWKLADRFAAALGNVDVNHRCNAIKLTKSARIAYIWVSDDDRKVGPSCVAPSAPF